MATKTDIELKIVDSVDTSHSDAEVLTDSASNPDAFYVGRGYLAHNGDKVIEGIDTDGTYPNVTVGNATKATKDGDGKNIAENYALISDTVGKFGILNSPDDRSAVIPNSITNLWSIDNTMFSVVIYERSSSSEAWVEKWASDSATTEQKANIEKGSSSSILHTSTRGSQVRIVVTAPLYKYVKVVGLYLVTKDGTYSGNIDYTAASYYDNTVSESNSGSLSTWGNFYSAPFFTRSATSIEYIFNNSGANAVIQVRGYRILTANANNPILIGKALKAYEADKATTADTATRANTAATAATAVNISDAPVLTATEGEQITVKVGNKTSNALTVPYAQRADFATDLSGRVEATPEVFTYRPSAGDKSIKDDNAFIRRVKGNSVVWNQLIRNAIDQSGNNGWWARQGDATVEIVDTGIKFNFISGVSSIPMISQKALTEGHTYYISIEWEASDNVTMYVRAANDMYGDGASNILYFSDSAEGFDYCLFTPQSDQPYICIMPTGLDNDMGHYAFIKAIRVTDISRETYTAAEFRELYPNSYYPYNAGELRNLNCYGIRTVGFNQWDEQWEVGYISSDYGINAASSTCIRSAGYIRCIPNSEYYISDSGISRTVYFYDIDKKYIGYAGDLFTTPTNCAFIRFFVEYGTNVSTYNHDICINLHHTGYRDGEYEPYKEVTHALPLNKITNGEPLRKAGSVYDEINETEYIKRVGVRSYTEGDKDDATLLTDGTYTNYPLDEPIVTPITTPIDFNYYVEDFGTEEALLAEDSAPFSADIVYQFNATDQVRNNTRNIQRLQKTAFTPTGTTSQYIRGDGSYGNIAELSYATLIYDGNIDNPEDSEYNVTFQLTSNKFAKHNSILDRDSNVYVGVVPTNDTNAVAKYWFQIEVGDTIPNVTFENIENSDATFIINGTAQINAINIWYFISTDGGNTFFGEIKNYII